MTRAEWHLTASVTADQDEPLGPLCRHRMENNKRNASGWILPGHASSGRVPVLALVWLESDFRPRRHADARGAAADQPHTRSWSGTDATAGAVAKETLLLLPTWTQPLNLGCSLLKVDARGRQSPGHGMCEAGTSHGLGMPDRMLGVRAPVSSSAARAQCCAIARTTARLSRSSESTKAATFWLLPTTRANSV